MPKRKFRKKKLYRKINIYWIIFFIFSFFLFSAFAFFVYSIKDLPRPEKFNEGKIFQSTKIYDRTGKVLLYEISGKERRTVVPFSEISENIKKAVISAEDADFYKHNGFDLKAIIRAVLYDLKIGKPVQGGSTITQQLIRNYFLSQNKTIKRKTREIILATELEKKYNKDQILDWYLNLIPFGSNIYGVEEACHYFFNKKASDINVAEAAVLAAIIKAPTYYSPYGKNSNKLTERKNYILERMYFLGYITKEQLIKEKNRKITFNKNKQFIKAPHFVFFVKKELEKKYGEEYLKTNGLKIITTLDYGIQKTIKEKIKKWKEYIYSYGARNIGVVVLDPKTGEILSMVGSFDYFGEPFPKGCTPGIDCKFDPKVNVCLSLRQPGSSMKPLIYAKSFMDGLTPDTIVWDVKTEFNTNCSIYANQKYGKYNSKCYHPKNYDYRFTGPIQLKYALGESRNVPAVKVLYLSNLGKTLDFLKLLGIKNASSKTMYGLSVALGGMEVRLLNLSRAFSVLANQGIKNPLNYLIKIESPDGNIIEKENKYNIKVIPTNVVNEINWILSENKFRAPEFGVNSNLRIDKFPVAVKTGTTQNFNNMWVLGYNPKIVVGVWAGNNDNSFMSKHPAVTIAGPLWKDIIISILNKIGAENFQKPKIKKTGNPMIDGVLTDNHSLLYHLNRLNDPLFNYWEEGIKMWRGR